MQTETSCKQLQFDFPIEKLPIPTSIKEARQLFFSKGFDPLWIGSSYKYEPHKVANHNRHVVEQFFRHAKNKPGKHFYQLFLPMRQRRMMEIATAFFPFVLPGGAFNFSKNYKGALPSITPKSQTFTPLFEFPHISVPINYYTTVTFDSVAIETGKTHYTMQFYFSTRSTNDPGEINLYDSTNSVIRSLIQFRVIQSDGLFAIDPQETFVITNANSIEPKKYSINSQITPEISFLFLTSIFFPQLQESLKKFFSSDVRTGRAFQYFDQAIKMIFFNHARFLKYWCDVDYKNQFLVRNSDGEHELSSKIEDSDLQTEWQWSTHNVLYMHHILCHHYLARKFDYENNYLHDIFSDKVIPSNIIDVLARLNDINFASLENAQHTIDEMKEKSHLDLSLHQLVTTIANKEFMQVNVPKWAINQTINLCHSGAIKMALTDPDAVKRVYLNTNRSCLVIDAQMPNFPYVTTYATFELIIVSLLTFYSFVHQYHSHELEKIEEMYPSSAVADYILSLTPNHKTNPANMISGNGFPLLGWLQLVNTVPYHFSHQKLRRFFFQMFCLDQQTAIDYGCSVQILNDFCSMARNVHQTIEKLTAVNGDQAEYSYSTIINWRNCPDIKTAHDEMSKAQHRLKYPNYKCNNDYYSELDGLSHEVPGTTLKIVFAPDTTTVREWGANQRHCIGNYSDYINRKEYLVFGVWNTDEDKWWGHCIDYTKSTEAPTQFNVPGSKIGLNAWQFYGYGNSHLPEEEKKLIREFVLDLLFVQKPAKLEELKKQLEKTILEEPVASNDEVSVPAMSKESQLIAT